MPCSRFNRPGDDNAIWDGEEDGGGYGFGDGFGDDDAGNEADGDVFNDETDDPYDYDVPDRIEGPDWRPWW